MSKKSGLPANWLNRDEAEASMYSSAASTPADQEKPSASTFASNSASESDSVEASEDEGKQSEVKSTAEVPAPPTPPPAKKRPARVQFNHRILEDRDRKLQKYKTKHNTTMQAIVDQMVDEYLSARGLLDD